MKTILITLFTVTITTTVWAQKPDSLLARVRYTYINSNDTLKTGKVRSENMVLFLGKNASLYTSYDKITYELSEDQKSVARAMTRASSGNAPTVIKIDRSAGEWLSKTNYLSFVKEKKMFIKEVILGLGYLMEEALPELKWKITKDTATFSGIACQKAMVSYENKNWTAWFAPSLPFQAGPWKLQGLPGLIVEAFDEHQTIQFQFAGFDKANVGDFVRLNDIRKKPDSEPGFISPVDVGLGLDVAGAYFDNTIQLPNYQITRTTKKDFDKLKAAYQKDPKGFSKAQFGF